MPASPSDVLDRMVAAANAHDLDGLVDCFAVDYQLTDPVHPARSFSGAAQVRKNWTTMFTALPDLHLTVHDRVATAAGFWLEAAQTGTRTDGQHVSIQTVFIAEVDSGKISRARMYAAPVEIGGADIDAVFARMAGGSRSAPAPAPGDVVHGRHQP